MQQLKGIFKNISYTLSSNLLSLIVSVVVTLFLPKMLGVEEYGYYQLYLFYISYVGFLHFGWCDGIYLRYGGAEYDTLDKSKFKGQFFLLMLLQLVLSFILITILFFSRENQDIKEFILFGTILNMVILNLRTFLLFLLQATNRMKDYSFVTISDRIIFVVAVLLLLVLKINNIVVYIIFDIVGKFISLVIAMYKTKDISNFSNEIQADWNIKESIINISVGINLMFANIASTLILGIVRFGIQDYWSVKTFGKISLALSVSNMLMVFVNAVSLAIFPLLKRAREDKYSELYLQIRTFIMPIILTLLILFYPIKYLLSGWLPTYATALNYMGILFPIIVFEGKVSLITNTYLKALRKEREIFYINLISAILSLITTIFSIYILGNLYLAILSIPILLGIRSGLADIVLSYHLKVSIWKDMVLEYLLVSIFIISTWSIEGVLGLIVYSFSLGIYLLIKKNDIILLKKSVFKK